MTREGSRRPPKRSRADAPEAPQGLGRTAASQPQLVRDLLAGYLDRSGLRAGVEAASVIEEWPELVGPGIAAVTRIWKVSDGVLGVGVGAEPDEAGAPESHQRREARGKIQANRLRHGRLIRKLQVRFTPSLVVGTRGSVRGCAIAGFIGHSSSPVGYSNRPRNRTRPAIQDRWPKPAQPWNTMPVRSRS